MSLIRPRLVIGGTGSGVGKTTFTLGLMSALQKRGLTVQGFKVGPDYIDPTYHSAVTGRPSRNLDTWMTKPDVMLEIFERGSQAADISVIEGVMGFYDGKDPLSNQGSTAEVATMLQAPTILIVNIASMARSAAAIVKGFSQLSPDVKIAGVILNQAGSAGHISLCQAAIEQECGIPVLGGLVRTQGIEIPERHLGLVPAIERGELQPLFEQLAEYMEAHLDVGRLIELAHAAPAIEQTVASGSPIFTQPMAPRVNIAVAKDAAFNFYYKENLELLEQAGAKLLFFSPLAGEVCPSEADALYIGGGFPEEFAEDLSSHEQVRASIRQRIEEGMPTLAECGGYMYLGDSLTDRAGHSFPMVGLLPVDVQMQSRLAALGYREVMAASESNFLLGPDQQARGHEFHYSVAAVKENRLSPAYKSKGLRGTKEDGLVTDSLIAGYTHLYFPSNPDMAKRFVQKAVEYARKRKTNEGGIATWNGTNDVE